MEEMHARYASLFQKMELGVIFQDSEGKITDSNPAAEKILGYSHDQLKKMDSSSSAWQATKLDGSDFPGNEHPSMLALRTGEVIKDVEMGIIHPLSKEKIWINLVSVPVFENGNKKPSQVFTTFHDVTEKLKIQNELKETENKFRALFENGPIGIAYHKMIYDEKGEPIDYFFLDANDNYQKLTGIDPRGKLVTEAIPGIENDPSDWIGTFARAGKYGETIRFQQYLQPIDRWYDAVGYQSSPDHFVAAFIEITEQKKKEIELERLKDELEDKVKERTRQLEKEKENAEAANRAKTAFLANMSHELRTPLNAVLGYAEILSSKEVEQTRKQYLNSISTSGKTLLSLINDVLDLSKIETGKFELQHSAVSVKNIFEELKIIFHQKVVDKGLTWKVNIDSNVPQWLLLDEMRLRQILVNLVGNAVKFTEQGSISLNCYQFKGEPAGEGELHLQIDVMDTGKGIEKEDLKRIFFAFEQAKKQKVSEYGGTGLGLAISKNLAELMNGSIEVKSTPNKGSVFSLIIKHIELAKGIKNIQKEHLIAAESIKFEPAHILIVDDIDYNRDMLGTFLQPYNLRLSFANNGKEALESIKKQPPDLLLLDMKMPVMTGYELSKILKSSKNLKNIPIIAISASSLAEDEKVIKKDCEGFLRKPVSRIQVVNEMTRFLKHNIIESQHNIEVEETSSNYLITDQKVKKELFEMLKDGDMDSIVNYAESLQKEQPKNKKSYHLLKKLANACNESEIEKMLG